MDISGIQPMIKTDYCNTAGCLWKWREVFQKPFCSFVVWLLFWYSNKRRTFLQYQCPGKINPKWHNTNRLGVDILDDKKIIAKYEMAELHMGINPGN